MAEKPILFSGEMVQAILNGHKTQTRRVIPPSKTSKTAKYFDSNLGNWPIDQGTGKRIACPYGRPGDLLWVRETWQAQNMHGQWYHEVPYAERSLHFWAWTNPINPAFDAIPPQWLPSIHMPRWASRITLRVCDVRVERVQDISDTSILAEGIPQNGRMYDPSGITHSESLRNDFCNLWDSINAKRGYGWDVNPWVWVVSFEVVR